MVRSSIPERESRLSVFQRVQAGSKAHPAFCPIGTGVLSLWLKEPYREADHPNPFSVRVMNVWSYTSSPLISLHADISLIKCPIFNAQCRFAFTKVCTDLRPEPQLTQFTASHFVSVR